MRRGLVEMFRAAPDVEVVGEASDGNSAIALVGELQPAVVVMDINMPGMSGIEATKAIHRQWPDVRVIGLSMFDEAEQAAAMRNAGASGYCSKSAAPKRLLATIRSCVRAGTRRAQGARAAERPAKRARAASLDPRRPRK
jgi:DNA-binding NarL/FixJ family response regulator